MIVDTDNGFRITLDDDQRLRAKARLCWFWRYGNLEIPADWNEDQLRQFIAGYDIECKAWIEAQDAAKTQEAKPFQLVDDSALVGRPSPGRFVLAHPQPTEAAPEPEAPDSTPRAITALTRRN